MATRKNLTIQELTEIIKNSEWERFSEVEVSSMHDVLNEPQVIYGYAFVESVSKDYRISYIEDYSYTRYNADSFETSPDDDEPVIIQSIDGSELYTIVDPDYDYELCNSDLIELLPEEFKEIDYSGIDLDESISIDTDKEGDTDMEKFTVQRDNEPNIIFCGELIASASTSDNNACGNYSGDVGRWTVLKLYRTASGKYICSRIGRTRWQGEHDRYSGAVCENVQEVIDFFGHRWLAKELYDEAGIEDAINVD